jgi:hypothetical protein
MPRNTERNRLLATIAETQEALGLHLATQLMMDEALALDQADDTSDSTSSSSTGDEDGGFHEALHRTASGILDGSERLQRRIQAVRYAADRPMARVEGGQKDYPRVASLYGREMV